MYLRSPNFLISMRDDLSRKPETRDQSNSSIPSEGCRYRSSLDNEEAAIVSLLVVGGFGPRSCKIVEESDKKET